MQFCITLVLAAIGLGFSSSDNALSILLGGLVCGVTNGLYIWLYFYRQPKHRDAQSVLRTAYKAELYKVILSVILLVTVLVTYDNLNVLLFFAAFFISQLVYWVSPLLLSAKAQV